MIKRMRTFYEEWKIIEPNSVLLTTDIKDASSNDNSANITAELKDESLPACAR